MIDIHSHLIFGVDDGSSNIEESLKMIAEAEKKGIRTIIATPHYHEKIYKNEGVLENFETLISKASDYQVDIRLGNEFFADEGIFNFIKSQRKLSFDNMQYILVELPLNASIEYSTRLIHKISAYNIRTIVAHPERNRNMTKNFAGFIDFINETNCRIQIEAGSIVGIYGSRVKSITKQLLRLKAVDYLATNAHSSREYAELYPRAVNKIYKLCDEEYALKILELNATEILTTTVKSKYSAI